MTKSAWLGLCIALLLPIGSYMLVKGFGETAANMPRRFFADSVTTRLEDGKVKSDTIWHSLPDFQLTNHLGETISLQTMEGKILVVNSFFTRCPNICPGLTRNMRRLQQSFENPKRKKFGDTSIVYFLSLSVDPARDSVQALKRWADRFYVNSDNWSLATGDRSTIYNLLLNDLRLASQHGEGVDSNFIHSERVMLLDKKRVVRGYYNGLDSTDMGRLAEDIGKLHLEKDKTRPSVFRAFIPILPLIAFVPLIVFVGMYLLKKRSKRNT